MEQLFGTDGIRGLAGEFPLDEKTVRIIGASLSRQFHEKLGREPRFITGRDTRESGEWIENAFHEGANSENAICESAAVITTDFSMKSMLVPSKTNHEETKSTKKRQKKSSCSSFLRGWFSLFQSGVTNVRDDSSI